MDIDAAGMAAAEPVADAAEDGEPGRAVRPALAELQSTAIGSRAPDGSISVRRAEPPRAFLYGPFWRLPQGRYRLSFACQVQGVVHPANPVLGLEIIALNRLQQGWRDFTSAELAGGRGFVEFDVPPALSLEAGDLTRFEFRFVHLGNAALRVTAVELWPIEDTRYEPLPPPQWRLLGRLEPRQTRPLQGPVAKVSRFERAGCVLRRGRPYIQVGEGRYRVVLHCRSANTRVGGQPVVGVEVVGLRGRYPWTARQGWLSESPARDRLVLGWGDFLDRDLTGGSASFEFDVPFAFSVETGDAPWLEFKVFHLGNADLEIVGLDLQRCGEADPDNPVPQRWRLLGRIGRQFGREGDIAVRRNDRPGALTGRARPRLELPPGHYRLLLTARLDPDAAPAAPVFEARIAVAAEGWRQRGRHIVAERSLTVAEFRDGVATLDFAIPPEKAGTRSRVELRLSHFGETTAALNGAEIVGVAPPCQAARAGVLPTRRQNVLIIGNCQAETVAEAFRRAAPLRRRFDANYQFVGLQRGLQESGRRLLERADLLLVQDIKDWEWYPLRDFIPASAEIVEFPFLRFASLWPFDGYGGINDVEAHQREWPDLTFIYLDGLLGRLRKEIPDKEARFQAYRSLDVPGVVNYVRLHDFERRHLEALDRKFGCDVGKFILDNFRDRQLFFALNHPDLDVFRVLLNWMMRRLGIEGDYTEPLEHLEVVRRVQVPVHPKVAQTLGVTWANEQTLYRYEGRQITWEQYVRAYIDHYG